VRLGGLALLLIEKEVAFNIDCGHKHIRGANVPPPFNIFSTFSFATVLKRDK